MEKTCDILILSASYGGGHNQTARALTQEIAIRHPGLKVLTVDYCDLIFPLLNKLSHFGYMQSLRHFPAGYGMYYQATEKMSRDSFWQNRLNGFGHERLLELLNQVQPRIIISVFPLSSGAVSELKRRKMIDIPLYTIVTDYRMHNQWIHEFTDGYLVGSDETARALIAREVPESKVYVTGIPLLHEFVKNHNALKIKKDYGLNPEDQIVLFISGNDGLFGSMRFHSLLHSLPGHVKPVVVCGTNQELYEKMQILRFKYVNLLPVKNVDCLAQLMSISRLLVTKAGGITISEALALGLPMVIYRPLPGQEEGNANYLWRKRAAIIAKSERRVQTAVLRFVADDDFRERFSKRALEIGHKNSAQLAVDVILSSKNLWNGV